MSFPLRRRLERFLATEPDASITQFFVCRLPDPFLSFSSPPISVSPSQVLRSPLLQTVFLSFFLFYRSCITTTGLLQCSFCGQFSPEAQLPPRIFKGLLPRIDHADEYQPASGRIKCCNGYFFFNRCSPLVGWEEEVHWQWGGGRGFYAPNLTVLSFVALHFFARYNLRHA